MTGSLVPAYRHLHNRGEFPGMSIQPFVVEITELVTTTGVKTMLDYGCGKGFQYSEEFFHEAWGIRPKLYDPGVQAHDRKPKRQFDAVVCTDVLEHIPEDELDEVIADLVHYAMVWAFVSVCCRPAKRKFPDGRNVHVTIRPMDWWQKKLVRAFRGKARLILRETP